MTAEKMTSESMSISGNGGLVRGGNPPKNGLASAVGMETQSCLESLSAAAIRASPTCKPVNPCRPSIRSSGNRSKKSAASGFNFNVDLSSNATAAASTPGPSLVVKEFTVTGNKLTLVDEDSHDASKNADFDLESSSSYSDDYGEDEDPVIGTCLHCSAPPPSAASNAPGIQVSCDGCHSFICSNCHWCHEYQANHEIRVCDRCDGFYCKDCDEMDQCEDCGEVVCGGCGSLCSCKFCGCGLCEECATSCGR